ncbi:hypothetical protein Nwi_1580 [Nitrobacter winogradskyi Nb-255]|uniref:Uncharacterized protein n=2 Tax=Nitrobacter winogradskyi TaxID=913 RepID=Q3SSA0_NITWN|nr:hypothetical protein Nwi_1580 [Nitrobacter winogradskyi Nb-255]
MTIIVRRMTALRRFASDISAFRFKFRTRQAFSMTKRKAEAGFSRFRKLGTLTQYGIPGGKTAMHFDALCQVEMITCDMPPRFD